MSIYKQIPSDHLNLSDSALNEDYPGLYHTPYTYLIGWTKFGVWYYGCRTSKNCHPRELFNINVKKPYLTSSHHVYDFIQINGFPDIVQIRKIFDNKIKCIKWESTVLSRLNVKHDPKFLNKHNGDGDFIRNKPHTNRTKNKISIIHTGKKQSKEAIESRSKALTGKNRKPFTDEHRENIGKAQIGIVKGPMKEETKEKLRILNTGMEFTEERCNNISKALSGRILTEEHKANCSKALIGHKGCIHTEEMKKHLSELVKDLIQVKDFDGNNFQIHKDDPRWTTGELGSPNSKGYELTSPAGTVYRTLRIETTLANLNLTSLPRTIKLLVGQRITFIINNKGKHKTSINKESLNGWTLMRLK